MSEGQHVILVAGQSIRGSAGPERAGCIVYIRRGPSLYRRRDLGIFRQRAGDSDSSQESCKQIAEAPETESKENTMSQETDLLDRITVRPDVFGGKPIIRDMRIAVEHVLANLAAGGTVEDILRDYPFLEPEDIQACLLFAHRSLAGEHVHDRVAVREAS